MNKLKKGHFCPHSSPSSAIWVKVAWDKRLNLQFDAIYNDKFENWVVFFPLSLFCLTKKGGNIKAKAKLNYKVKYNFNFSRWAKMC